MAPQVGTTYRNVEEYLIALEKRQAEEKAPPAAVFMLGSVEMLLRTYADHPWLTRVRCELPTRPLGPGGEEEPVRATYFGALDEEDPKQYETFVKGMASIDVFKCMHLKAKPAHPHVMKAKPGPGPSAKALAHLEQSDIIVIGDGPNTEHAWFALAEGGDGLMDRIKWRYYSGAVLIAIGRGAQFVGKTWWGGLPQLEAETNRLLKEGKPVPKRSEDERYNSGKASEIVPAFLCVDSEEAEAICELHGSVGAALVLPKSGGIIFNIDGTLEPCCSMLMEYCWDWKTSQVKSYVLTPPDEKTNVLKCAEYVERRKAKLRAKRLEMGLDPDAPGAGSLDGEDDTEDDDGDGDEDDEQRELRAEAEREAVRSRRFEQVSPLAIVSKNKREEAEADRQRGADFFKQGKWERALESFDLALTKAPDDPKAHLNRAAALLKLERPRRAVLAADRALHLTHGTEAKAWYRRAACWLATGEFNECIADCEQAKSLEPADRAIKELRAKAEKEREDETWSFAMDSANLGLIAARTMMDIEVFSGNEIELVDGELRMRWLPTHDDPDGHEEVVRPARLDIRAMFCIEEATKRSALSALTIRGACLGAWGAAFVARGARLEGAGLERLHLVDCRLREAGAKSVASLLSRGSRLIDVDLSGNGIGDGGLYELARELKKNEYLERLTLQRNRIVGNRRLATLGEAISEHPTLRSVDLSHNLIGFHGACHLAKAVQVTEVLQRLSVAHNKLRADGVHRLCSVAVGHPSLATIDLRGVYLRASDRRRLDHHTRFTRLQIFIDAPLRRAEEDVEGMAALDEGASTWGPSPLDHSVHQRSKTTVQVEEGGEEISELELELRKARANAAAESERLATDPGELSKAETIARMHEARKRQELRDVDIVPGSLLHRPDVRGDGSAESIADSDDAAAPFEPREDPDEMRRKLDEREAERATAEAKRKLDDLHDLADHVWLFEFSKLGLY